MARHTVYLPSNVDVLVQVTAREDESYSETVARLILAGLGVGEEVTMPSWIGAGEGPEDFSINAEK